jgi:L-fuconolactonase
MLLHIMHRDHRKAINEYNIRPFRQGVYTLLEILEDVCDGHNVVGTVYTEANSFYWNSHQGDPYAPVGEVEFCQGVAAACDSGVYGASRSQPGPRVCWGIQGSLDDLGDPEAPAVLEYMTKTRNFRGIRGPHTPTPAYDDAFKRGFAAVRDLGLVYDCWLGEYNPEDLPRLQALAEEFPSVPIVLDHLGAAVGPKLSEEEARSWRENIASLASACPNVVCKVGGERMHSLLSYCYRQAPYMYVLIEVNDTSVRSSITVLGVASRVLCVSH